jgi:hypothetical protein
MGKILIVVADDVIGLQKIECLQLILNSMNVVVVEKN